MQYPLITVIGGSGFLGRHLVKQLCQEGYRVRVICRDIVAAQFLKVSGDVGQVALLHADITQKDALKGKLDGSFAVVYLPGILYQSGRQKFNAIHRDAAAKAAAEAARIGAERFVMVSAMKAEKSRAHYGKSKFAGEQAVKAAFPAATIMRPSLIIGPEDGFFQRFARMNLIAPGLPLIAGGRTKFQPIYVLDVAKAISAALREPASKGAIYELAGPKTYSFRELLNMMARITHRRVRFIYLPGFVAKFIGFFCELLPLPPQITRDQVRALSVDNVASDGALGLAALQVEPTAIEAVLPELLDRFIKR